MSSDRIERFDKLVFRSPIRDGRFSIASNRRHGRSTRPRRSIRWQISGGLTMIHQSTTVSGSLGMVGKIG